MSIFYFQETYSPEVNSRTFYCFVKFSSTLKAHFLWKICYNVFVWITWNWWLYEIPWRN